MVMGSFFSSLLFGGWVVFNRLNFFIGDNGGGIIFWINLMFVLCVFLNCFYMFIMIIMIEWCIF